ncbi:thymidylate kinase [Rhodnius prolixus]|uniref:Thymidylate kinase n=2 Tax=Rhodnius TaxID=13248 RepID=T1HFS6_RHOPR
MFNRGALIVIEGVDRSGKSTQCTKLVEKLNKNNIAATLICFPDRTTSTGKLINDYLTKSVDLPDQVIHLLFTANRWELEPAIHKYLANGVSVIVDRYSFSGVAYSVAKQPDTKNLEWFKNPETGLPKPDGVFYLQLEQNMINGRKGFGEERYDCSLFQKKVAECFAQLMDDSWQVIDANKTVNELSNELYDKITEIIDISKNKPILTLW